MSKIGEGVSVEVLHIYEVEKLCSIQPFFKPLAELSNGGNTLNKSLSIRILTEQGGKIARACLFWSILLELDYLNILAIFA